MILFFSFLFFLFFYFFTFYFLFLMKKIYFLAAAVAAALSVASCATSEVVDSELAAAEAVPIGFGTFLDRVSRDAAAASPKAAAMDATGLQDSGFVVLAYYTGGTDWASYTAPANPDFMDDQKVTYSSGWKYTPLKYWPRKDNDNTGGDDWGKVTFFAFSRSTDAIASADGTQGENPKITFTTPQLAKNQVDLVAAVVPNATGSGGGKVLFAFKHILSRIGFTAKLSNDFDATGTTVTVKYLRVFYTADQIAKGKTYTFANTNDAGTWSATSTSTMDVGGGDTLYSGTASLTNGEVDLCAPNKYLMLIPQAAAAGGVYVNLDFDVTVDKGASYSTSFKVPLPATTWEMGKAYTYNLVVTLTGVEFDTPTVADWGAGTAGDSPI
jgi:hypothetical protein